MPHLARTRKGWENERLASFLLSRFSFVAHPASVADDLGSDFFCTIFETRTVSRSEFLIPRSSFAIQIKSNSKPLNVHNKIDYLESLELPFFVGIVDQARMELTIYSAEFLPLFFSKEGSRLEALFLLPVGADKFETDKYYSPRKTGGFNLRCPSVITLRAAEGGALLRRKVDILRRLCRRVHGNIATRASEEHVYDIDDAGNVNIMAGPGSVKVFRNNFLKRFAEVLRNLSWIFENDPKHFEPREFALFEALHLELGKLGWRIPPAIDVIYAELKEQLRVRSV